MALVVVTRLQPRGWHGALHVLRMTTDVLAGMQPLAGYLGGRLLVDRRLAFWTATLWTDRHALSAFRELHRPVAARVDDVARASELTAWAQDDAIVPAWAEIARRWPAVRPPAAGLSRDVPALPAVPSPLIAVAGGPAG